MRDPSEQHGMDEPSVMTLLCSERLYFVDLDESDEPGWYFTIPGDCVFGPFDDRREADSARRLFNRLYI